MKALRILRELVRDCVTAIARLAIVLVCLVVALLYRLICGEWPHVGFPMDRD